MAYRVELSPRAQGDLDRIYERILGVAPCRGTIWFDRFEQEIQSLSSLPERYPVLPRHSTSARIVRQLLFGRRRHVYRIFYTIIGEAVWVIHVRHGARRDPVRL